MGSSNLKKMQFCGAPLNLQFLMGAFKLIVAVQPRGNRYLKHRRERTPVPQKTMNGDVLLDPVRNALNSIHAHFAVGCAPARRYVEEGAPFGGLRAGSEPRLRSP